MSTITVKVVIVNDADGMTLERSDITKEIEKQGMGAAVQAAMEEAVKNVVATFTENHLRVLRAEHEALEVDAAKAEEMAKMDVDIETHWKDYAAQRAELEGRFRDAGIKRRFIKQTMREIDKNERRRDSRF